MTYPYPFGRPVIIRARRDTVALVALATMSTFALAHVIHSHRIAMPNESPQGWTGHLAGLVAPDTSPRVSEPLTSASLVVPELALPQAPVRALVKLRGCAGASCLSRPSTKIADAPLPPRKLLVEKASTDIPRKVAALEPRTIPRPDKGSLMSRLNPLGKLPDASTIKRPFAFASDAVSGWFKRF